MAKSPFILKIYVTNVSFLGFYQNQINKKPAKETKYDVRVEKINNHSYVIVENAVYPILDVVSCLKL